MVIINTNLFNLKFGLFFNDEGTQDEFILGFYIAKELRDDSRTLHKHRR